MKRILAFFLSMSVLLLMIPLNGVLAVDEKGIFEATGINGETGSSVTVQISVKDNPGVTNMQVLVGYDENNLELTAISGKDFSGASFGPITANPIAVSWSNTLNPNNTANGILAELTFKIKDNAASGKTNITLTYDPDNVYNSDWDNVEFSIVNGYVDIAAKPAVVTNVTINKDKLSLKTGEAETLIATVLPDNATNKAVTWKSSDSSVATVSDTGKVTAIKEGTATVTVTTQDGSYSASCTVSVACSHTNKSEEPSKSPDCVNPGNHRYYTCDSCGMAFKADGITQTTVDAETIPATGHSYNEADCTTPKTCKVCTATDGTALGHSFTDYISNNDATCTEDGTKTAKCDRCTKTDTVTDAGSAKGHDYIDATCTAPKTCTVCNATEGSALGHSFTNYTSNNDATCTQDGTKTAKCDRCTKTDTVTDVGSTKGHDFAAATCTLPKTCKVCNVTEGFALGHSYNTVWSKGEEGHWHECSTCGDKIDQTAHDFGTVGDTCVTCAYERSHVHRLTLISAKDATCTDAGNKAYYTCSGCENWFEDASGAVLIADKTTVVIDALGHDYADATCTTSKTCKVCDTTEGAALGHSYSSVWSKGEEDHWHECSACGDKRDLAEHDFGTEGDKCTICEYERSHVHRLTPVSGVDATCTENGSKAYYTCSGCEDWFEDALGTVLIADKSAVVVPAQGHDFEAATCTTVKTCKNCGVTEGALLNHSDANSDGKCDMCGKATTPTAQPDPSTPATGDDSDVFVWLMLMFVSIGAIAVCLIGSKKRLFR